MTGAAFASGESEREQLLRRGARTQQAAGFYREACSGCHGPTGGGRPAATATTPVPDFTSPAALVRLSVEGMVRAVREGHDQATRTSWSDRGDGDVVAVVEYIREMFMLPAPVADASLGRKIYARTCSVCHGDRGDGASWARNGLNPPPLDFTSAQARSLTRLHMLDTVSHGRPGTAMVGFSTQLSRVEIAAVVDYIRAAYVEAPIAVDRGGAATRGASAAAAPKAEKHDHGHAKHDMSAGFATGLSGDRTRGHALYAKNCVPCHGENGDGKGPRAYFQTKKPADFTRTEARGELNRPHLFEYIANGVLATEMPAWSKVLSDQQIADLAEYVFTTFIQPLDQAQAPSSTPHDHRHEQGHGVSHDHGDSKKN